jgi:hypothetical protein
VLIDRRVLIGVGLASILASPILFLFELVLSPLLVAFGVAFHRLRPLASARLITAGTGLAAGPIAYVLLAIVVAVL